MGIQIDTDETLLARVREGGDVSSFAVLYARHAAVARRFARSRGGNESDVDDLVADVFTGLLASLRGGRGPSVLALPYLFASIRHRQWHMAGQRARDGESARHVGSGTSYAEPIGIDEATVLRAALATLPGDVQKLLWRTEVDDESVTDVATSDGISAHNAAVHLHRARRALATAYLAQHAEPDGGICSMESECRASVPDLAPLVRRTLGIRRRRQLEAHLAQCDSCSQARQRLESLNNRLRTQPRPPGNRSCSVDHPYLAAAHE